MGHDISGYRTTDTEQEIAYLRRSAFNELNSEIYNALNCPECSGGVSGNGTDKEFTKNELINALIYINNADNTEELEPERKFVNDCLANLDENDKILIGFY